MTNDIRQSASIRYSYKKCSKTFPLRQELNALEHFHIPPHPYEDRGYFLQSGMKDKNHDKKTVENGYFLLISNLNLPRTYMNMRQRIRIAANAPSKTFHGTTQKDTSIVSDSLGFC